MTLRRKPYRDEDAEAESRVDLEELEEETPDAHPVRSLLGFLLVMAAVALLFGVLAARTAGFREIVAVKSLEWFQARPAIQASRIAFPYDLVLTGVTVPAKAGETPGGLSIPEVRVAWRPSRGLTVTLDKPVVNLYETEPGVFLPEELAKLGSITNAAGIADWLAPLDRRATLFIRAGLLEVHAAEGAVIRRLDAIGLAARPVMLPGRPVTHCVLAAGPMTAAQGHFNRLEQEWLTFGGTGVVEIAFRVDSAVPWGRDFWKGHQP